MKTKNIFLKLFAAMVVLTPFCSCSLEEDTSALSNPDDFFRKYTECESVVDGCYYRLRNLYTYATMLVTECVSDLAYCPSGTYDARLDISPSTPRYGNDMWRYGYNGVQRCNFAVQGIEKAYGNGVLTEEQYYDLLCQAKALRGHYYWYLTCVFGNVPFYFDDVSDNEVLERIRVLPRMDANETRDTVIEDLWSIAPYASQTRTSDNDGNRVGAALAYMVIAKMAMWNEEWDVALEACRYLEDIYGDFSQYDYAENAMFRNKNTPESILEVQHEYVEGGTILVSNVANICMPRPRTNGTDIYDGVEIPELGDQAECWVAMRPNEHFFNKLQTRYGKDNRTQYNIVWEYNGVEFDHASSYPWMGPKFWCPNIQLTYDSNNYKVFRYADVMLMIAECLCNLGEYDEAVQYVNKTRVRAGLDEYVFRTSARLMEEIQDERGRELLGEFQRKFDLVRWGIWYDQVTKYSDYAYLQDPEVSSSSLIKPCHRYYPIPDVQVAASKYSLDNDEYNAYGL